MTKTKSITSSQLKAEPAFFTEYDRYLFGNGRDYKIYEKMGAHPAVIDQKKGMRFDVWAPRII